MANSCPNCGRDKIKPRRGFRHALIDLAVFVVLIIVLANTYLDPRKPSTIAMVLIVVTFFVVLPMSFFDFFAALFGKNRCLLCKHKWR